MSGFLRDKWMDGRVGGKKSGINSSQPTTTVIINIIIIVNLKTNLPSSCGCAAAAAKRYEFRTNVRTSDLLPSALVQSAACLATLSFAPMADIHQPQ